MKRLAMLCLTTMFAQASVGADSAGLVAIMNTSGTVKVNNDTQPKTVWSVYLANDPAEQNTLFMKIAYRHEGVHELSVEMADESGKVFDRCTFTPTTVSSVPHIESATCNFGGRLPTGGITFTVLNQFGGNKEKLGEMFLPHKP